MSGSLRGAARRLYRLALRLLPPSFRRRFGPDMLAEFTESLHEDAEVHGGRVRPGFLLGAAGDLAGTLAVEWGDATARRGAHLMTGLGGVGQDLTVALRSFTRSPSFALAVVGTLALGIGGNTAVFSVVNAVVLRPLSYPEPDRLVTLWSQQHWPYGTNVAEYLDLRDRQTTLSGIAIHDVAGANLTGLDGTARRVSVALVTGAFFPVLGTAPALGRTIGDADDEPGRNTVAVLRHEFWEREFGADPGAIGRTVLLDDRLHTIVGIMPPGFSFPDETRSAWSPGSPPVDLWIPAGIDPARPGGRGGHGLPSVARLKPDVRLERASGEIRAISLAMHEEHPDAYAADPDGWTLRLEPLGSAVVGELRPALLALWGAVGLVLLIACSNVAHLLLARAVARRGEIAVRRALGVGRGRLVRQVLTESALLAVGGGAVGLALARGCLPWLTRLAPPEMPRISELEIESAVLLFTLSVSIATGILVGLIPAWHAGTGDLQVALRRGWEDAAGRGSGALRRVLVSIEVAVTVILLVEAGLLIRSLGNLRGLDLGYRTEGLLTYRVTLPSGSYPSPADRMAFFEELAERIGAQPGVRAAAAISQLPLARDFSSALMAEGMPADRPALPHGLVNLAAPRTATASYAEVMGLTVLRGRFLTEADREDAPRVVVVGDAFARDAWPGEDALGKRVAFPSSADPEWYTVVGVVRDTREEAGNLASDRYRDVYFSLQQRPVRDMYGVVRVGADPASFAPVVRRVVAAADPNLPVYEVRPMDAVFRRATARSAFNARLMSALAILAMLLGAVGVHAVTAYVVGRDRREMGIRIALGAAPRALLARAVRNGMTPVLAGLAIGIVGGVGVTRLLGTMLYGVTSTDPSVYVCVVAVLGLVGLIACYLPARRTLRIDPVEALRRE